MSDTKRSLPGLSPAAERLGRATIMDRALAAEHGIAYVHLAAFAIDVDRVREEVEGDDDPRPFGWEVFLTERYLLDHLDLETHTTLIDDSVLSILDGDPAALGSQLAFSIWDAIERGHLPGPLRAAFKSWRSRPKELIKALRPLWEEEAALVPALARGCLEVELSPPLSPPTRAALEALRGSEGP